MAFAGHSAFGFGASSTSVCVLLRISFIRSARSSAASSDLVIFVVIENVLFTPEY